MQSIWWAVGTNSLLTLLTPFCVRGEYAAVVLIIFRIIVGAAEGSVLPAYTEMLLAWFPAKERTRSISMVTAGTQVSNIICTYANNKIFRHFTSIQGRHNCWGSTFRIFIKCIWWLGSCFLCIRIIWSRLVFIVCTIFFSFYCSNLKTFYFVSF